MSTQIQRRRGTTAEHSTFTGADGELTVDTTKDTVVVHDATTVGGHPLQKQYPPLGSAAAPTYTFTGDPNTGIYSPGADQVAVATNGTGSCSNHCLREKLMHHVFHSGKVRIQSVTGNVGIGTTSPVNVGAGYNGLTVNGSTGGTIYLQGGGTSGGRLVATSTDFYIGTVQAGGNLIFQHQDGSYERARIDSSGRLLVGTSTARTNYFPTTDALTPNVQLEASRGGLAILGTGNGSDLFIGKGSSVTAADDFLGEICFTGFDGTNNRTAARILCQTDAACGAGDMPGRLVFSTTANGAATPTEQLRITSDRYVRLAAGTGGIQFNGDTVAANALDDYEEGTFTPVIIGSITTGTATYSSQNGKYTKVGNRVFWEIYIDWTGGTGTGNLRVSGLPFTISNTLATFPAASIGYAQNVTISADHQLIALQASNNTYVYFYQIPSGGGVNVALDYDASGTMGLSGNYNVA
jgi:hypothetical protein